MQDDKSFLVKFERTVQTGPDEWAQVWTEKLFSPKETLYDVKLWMKEKLSIKDHVPYRIEKLELTEPE